MRDADKKALFESYSNKFTDRVTSEYFAKSARVKSADVMQVQPIKQVNLFVVKNLYDNWQRESGKLQSPYFDFQDPAVQEALQTFMNSLSHHVSLDKETYEELLLKSTVETLSLIFHPYDYYYDLLKNYESEAIPVKYLEYIAKYIKTNGHILKHMLEVLEAEGLAELPKDKVQWLIDQALQRTNEDPADVDPFIENFSKVIPLHLDDIYGGGKGPRSWEDSPESESADIEEVESVEQEDLSEPEPTPDTLEETPHEQAPEDDNEVQRETIFPVPNLHLSEDHKKAGKNLAEALANRVDYSFETPEKSILNDILSHEHGETLADQHQKSRIQDIRKSLSINQRFMFINSLFNGDDQAFDRTLDHLETIENEDDAMSFINHKFSNWDLATEEVQEFMLLIQRRYA